MNRTAVITGSSTGIGAAIAKEISDPSTNIVINYNNNKEGALNVLSELRKRSIRSIAIKADISNFSQASMLINTAIEEFGKIDILINNAGISEQKLFTEITPNSWEKMFQVNVHGMFYCTQVAVKDMLKRHCGKIINISSIWGLSGASCEVHYSSSKAAVIGFTKALAKELGPSHINVNCVAPGVIKTKMNDCLSDFEKKDLCEATPLGRIGETWEVAKAVKFLSSSDSDFITGQVISPNGGLII